MNFLSYSPYFILRRLFQSKDWSLSWVLEFFSTIYLTIMFMSTWLLFCTFQSLQVCSMFLDFLSFILQITIFVLSFGNSPTELFSDNFILNFIAAYSCFMGKKKKFSYSLRIVLKKQLSSGVIYSYFFNHQFFLVYYLFPSNVWWSLLAHS